MDHDSALGDEFNTADKNIPENSYAVIAPIETRLEFHDLANIFPMLDDMKLSELAKDIGEHGVRDPIICFQGKILDGRGRYVACQTVGIEPNNVDFTGDDALAFVISRNLHRRHMDESQRAMVAAKIANMPIGANQHSQGMPIGRASALLNVSTQSAARAKAVLNSGDVDLIAEVEAGNIAVSTAARSTHIVVRELPRIIALHVGDPYGGITDNNVSQLSPAPDEAELIKHVESASKSLSSRKALSRESAFRPGIIAVVGSASSAMLSVVIKIGATVTTGGWLPNHAKANAGDVFWISIHLRTRQRLQAQFEAAGSYQPRVCFLDPIRDRFGLPIRDLANDLERLKRQMPPSTTCVVIDYFSDYLAIDDMGPLADHLQLAISALDKLAKEKGIIILALCQIRSRDDGHVIELVNEIKRCSDVAVLRVMRADKPNHGILQFLLSENELAKRTFRITHRNGLAAIVWDDSFELVLDKAPLA